jgi:hypothetical protein
MKIEVGDLVKVEPGAIQRDLVGKVGIATESVTMDFICTWFVVFSDNEVYWIDKNDLTIVSPCAIV